MGDVYIGRPGASEHGGLKSENWMLEDEEDADLARQGLFISDSAGTIEQGPEQESEPLIKCELDCLVEKIAERVAKRIVKKLKREMHKCIQEEYANASSYLYEGQDEDVLDEAVLDESPDEPISKSVCTERDVLDAYGRSLGKQKDSFARLATPKEIAERREKDMKSPVGFRGGIVSEETFAKLSTPCKIEAHNREAMENRAKELYAEYNDVAELRREVTKKIEEEIRKAFRTGPTQAIGSPLPKIDPKNVGNPRLR